MSGSLLFAGLAAAALPAPAQDAAPVDTIRTAKLGDYLRMYPKSPLCESGELTLWSCGIGKREYALCSSRVVSRTSGYFQYRASKAGKTVLVYPPVNRPPGGFFTYEAYRNGDAAVAFANGGYHYDLMDSLRGNSSILVTSPKGKSSEIECGGNQTLQLNYTMRLMYDAGLWDR